MPTRERGISPNTPTNQIIEILSSAVEICGSSISNQRLQTPKFDLSHPPVFLCCLIHKLTGLWLDRSDLLGQYAMTTDRYGVALQCCAYYLLQLPRQVLLEILNEFNSRQAADVTPIVRLISQVLPTFLYRAPHTTGLYFLVTLTESVMKHITNLGNLRFISNYLRQVSILWLPWHESSRVSCMLTTSTVLTITLYISIDPRKTSVPWRLDVPKLQPS